MRARLEDAMQLGRLPDWLDEAERQIRAHQAMLRRRRLFDVSTPPARLRTAREVKGYTQRQLARRVGLKHHWAIQGFETGVRDLPARLIPRLCAACGINPTWLIDGPDAPGAQGPDYSSRQAPKKLMRIGWAKRTRLEKARHRAELELVRLRALRMDAGPSLPSRASSQEADQTTPAAGSTPPAPAAAPARPPSARAPGA